MADKPSGSFKLNKADGHKILKGAAIALLGSLLTYGTMLIPNLSIGIYAPFITALWSVIANAGWKFVRSNQN